MITGAIDTKEDDEDGMQGVVGQQGDKNCEPSDEEEHALKDNYGLKSVRRKRGVQGR